MICELSREKQVLVTTHDPDLLEMLAGHETIKIIKENGFSRIEK
jgi:predicted ATPase